MTAGAASPGAGSAASAAAVATSPPAVASGSGSGSGAMTGTSSGGAAFGARLRGRFGVDGVSSGIGLTSGIAGDGRIPCRAYPNAHRPLSTRDATRSAATTAPPARTHGVASSAILPPDRIGPCGRMRGRVVERRGRGLRSAPASSSAGIRLVNRTVAGVLVVVVLAVGIALGVGAGLLNGSSGPTPAPVAVGSTSSPAPSGPPASQVSPSGEPSDGTRQPRAVGERRAVGIALAHPGADARHGARAAHRDAGEAGPRRAARHGGHGRRPVRRPAAVGPLAGRRRVAGTRGGRHPALHGVLPDR